MKIKTEEIRERKFTEVISHKIINKIEYKISSLKDIKEIQKRNWDMKYGNLLELRELDLGFYILSN